MKKVSSLFVGAMMILTAACATSVDRIDTGEAIDLSGKWNDTDSRLVSEKMIQEALENPWLRRFRGDSDGKLPVVIVGTVVNRSHEHINIQTFVKDLERAFVNSGEVNLVAGRSEREEIRDERKDQASHSSEETAKSEGLEKGADYMLKGSINTIEDREGRTSVRFYQINLELINLETNQKAWIGEKKIKKLVKRPLFKL